MSQLAVPDMSRLSALLPGKESTIVIPVGQRLQIAVADSSRVSLIVSSDSVNALTLSTINQGSSSQGLNYPSGLRQPLMLTWDIYGGKLHDEWFVQNNGATDLNITTMEIMSRPNAAPLDKLAGVDLQPLKKCLPKWKPPVFDDMPIDDQPPPILPSESCEDAPFVGTGVTSGPYTCPIGTIHWFRVTAVTGFNKVTVILNGGMAGVDVQQGGCSSLHFVSFGNQNPPGDCQQGNYVAGPAWIRIFANGFSTITYSFKFENSPC